jgi:prephenate dehydrogenase
VSDGDFAEFGGFNEAVGFGAIGIVGLGLIGGSLALAVRERWPETSIVAFDRPEVLADALARGVISAGVDNLRALATWPLDAIVLAAPVLQNVACLREIAAAAIRPVLVTDVGSTKLSIVTAARDLAAGFPHLTFIGGHPIAGAAHGGLAHARVDMFRRRPWLFTPPDNASDADLSALGALRAFVRALGAEPAQLDADEHDRIMAYVSHLPQIASSSLMRVAGAGAGEPGLGLSGAGLADTTRLASSPASMWTEILQSNAGHVKLALDVFIADLQQIRDNLTTPAAGTWLDEGTRWRARLGNGQTNNPRND